ncbi:MAG: flagellar protein FliO/FliZ [Chthoniobacter sp.]|nr:flagellar protein FliO/FliZ [Chthoniobacter sp.]
MNWRLFALSLTAALVLAAPLRAQTKPDDARTSTLSPDTTLTPRPPASLFAPEKSTDGKQLIIYFVVLVALAAGGFYFLKRGLPLRSARIGENQLQLLETKMLGNRQFLVVVKYEDSKMLLGVGPGKIQYLCPLESADEDMENLIKKSGPAPEAGLA